MALSKTVLGPLLKESITGVDRDDYDSNQSYENAVFEAMADAIIIHLTTSGIITGTAVGVTSGGATAVVTGTIS